MVKCVGVAELKWWVRLWWEHIQSPYIKEIMISDNGQDVGSSCRIPYSILTRTNPWTVVICLFVCMGGFYYRFDVILGWVAILGVSGKDDLDDDVVETFLLVITNELEKEVFILIDIIDHKEVNEDYRHQRWLIGYGCKNLFVSYL